MLVELAKQSCSMNELGTEKAKVKIVSSGVGGISESDANLAVA